MNAQDFVVAAARLGAIGQGIPLPTLDSPDLWKAAVELAIDHRVAPLVAEAIARSPEPSVPAKVREALRVQQLRASATRLLCESTLASFVTLLRARGVEVIVLKGPTVAYTAYSRPDLRIYHDIDVLCSVADYPALYSTLLENGYTNAGTLDARGTQERLAQKPSPVESHSVRAFYDPTGDMKIEVHFDALQLGLRDRHAAQFWEQARRMQVSGVEIRCLAPEHQFLHLAVHAHRHDYSRLSWLIELDALIRQDHGSMDWAGLARLARKEGVGAILRHALATSHAVLGSPLPVLPPPSLEERCLGACYRGLWPYARTRALNQHERHRLLHFLPDDDDVRNVLYGLVLLGRRRDKLHALWRRTPLHGSS